jgi:hypothetical protein
MDVLVYGIESKILDLNDEIHLQNVAQTLIEAIGAYSSLAIENNIPRLTKLLNYQIQEGLILLIGTSPRNTPIHSNLIVCDVEESVTLFKMISDVVLTIVRVKREF